MKKKYQVLKCYLCITFTLSMVAMLVLTLTGCYKAGGFDLASNSAVYGFEIKPIKVADFTIQTAIKIQNYTTPLVVYIEGDGRAFATVDMPSIDPTPIKPIGWHLAKTDRSDNVAYIARPCQYLINQPECENREVWTSSRFSGEIVGLTGRVIDKIKNNHNQKIHLVGFSGGGAVATILAAQRHDVLSLRTIAGNLSVHEVNSIHRVSPMPESIDPIDLAKNLQNIPQVHLTGTNDEVIKPKIVLSFSKAVASNCVAILEFPVTHNSSSWARIWESDGGYSALVESLNCSKD